MCEEQANLIDLTSYHLDLLQSNLRRGSSLRQILDAHSCQSEWVLDASCIT